MGKVILEWSGMETEGRPKAKRSSKDGQVSLRDYVKISREGSPTFLLGAGDFVYMEPASKKQQPYVGRILDLFEDKDDNMQASVQWLYRPNDVSNLDGKIPSKISKNEIFYAMPHIDAVGLDTILERVPVEFTVLKNDDTEVTATSQFAGEDDDDGAADVPPKLVCSAYFDLKNKVLPLTLAKLEELEQVIPVANRVSTLLKDAIPRSLTPEGGSSKTKKVTTTSIGGKKKKDARVSSTSSTTDDNTSDSSEDVSNSKKKKVRPSKKAISSSKKPRLSRDTEDGEDDVDEDETDLAGYTLVGRSSNKHKKAAPQRNILLPVDTPLVKDPDQELLESLPPLSPVRSLEVSKPPTPSRSAQQKPPTSARKVGALKSSSPVRQSPSVAVKSLLAHGAREKPSSSSSSKSRGTRKEYNPNQPGINTQMWSLLAELSKLVGSIEAREVLGFLVLEALEAGCKMPMVPPVALQRIMTKAEVQPILDQARAFLGSTSTKRTSSYLTVNTHVAMRNALTELEKHRAGAVFDMLGRGEVESCLNAHWLFPLAIEAPVFGCMLGMDGFRTFRMTVHKQPIHVSIEWQADLLTAAEAGVKKIMPGLTFALLPIGDCEFEIAPTPDETFSDLSIKFRDGHIESIRVPLEKATLGMIKALVSARENVFPHQQTLRFGGMEEGEAYAEKDEGKLLSELGVHAYSALYLLA